MTQRSELVSFNTENGASAVAAKGAAVGAAVEAADILQKCLTTEKLVTTTTMITCVIIMEI